MKRWRPYVRVGRSIVHDTFSAIVVLYCARSSLEVLRVPFAMSEYVGCPVSYAKTSELCADPLITRAYALCAASAAILAKRRARWDLNPGSPAPQASILSSLDYGPLDLNCRSF